MEYGLALIGGILLFVVFSFSPLSISLKQKALVSGLGTLLSMLLLVLKSMYPLPIAILLVSLLTFVAVYITGKKTNFMLASNSEMGFELNGQSSRPTVTQETNSEIDIETLSEVVDNKEEESVSDEKEMEELVVIEQWGDSMETPKEDDDLPDIEGIEMLDTGVVIEENDDESEDSENEFDHFEDIDFEARLESSLDDERPDRR